MGQKINANSLRLGIIRGWESSWVTSKKDFPNNLKEDYLLRTYLAKHYPKGIIAKSIIERTIKNIILTIHTSKPGILIGPSGAKIIQLTKALKKICGKNIQVNVSEIRKPELNAQLVASSIATQIRARMPYKRIVKQTISNSMRAGAQGIKIWVAGRLAGVEIARCEKYKEGRVPQHTLRADIDYANVEAKTIYGIIGIKVWIFKKEVYGKRDLSLNLEVRKKPNQNPKRTFRKK